MLVRENQNRPPVRQADGLAQRVFEARQPERQGSEATRALDWPKRQRAPGKPRARQRQGERPQFAKMVGSHASPFRTTDRSESRSTVGQTSDTRELLEIAPLVRTGQDLGRMRTQSAVSLPGSEGYTGKARK